MDNLHRAHILVLRGRRQEARQVINKGFFIMDDAFVNWHFFQVVVVEF